MATSTRSTATTSTSTTPAGGFVGEFGAAEGPYPGLSGAEGVAVNDTTHIVYVANNGRVDSFKRTGNITIPDVTTEGAEVTATTATVHANVDRDVPNGGAPINACVFKYGTDPANLSNEAPCEGSAPFSGAVQATFGGLTTGTTYYYRITAANESNSVFASGGIKELQPAGPPEISEESVSSVNTDGAVISGRIAPGGGLTEWWIEFGPTLAYGGKLPVTPNKLKDNLAPENVTLALSGLTAGTHYHYRFVAENPSDKTEGDDHTFTTFASPATGPDSCSNAQVRQQTGAAQLLDCRAYELASAWGHERVRRQLDAGSRAENPWPAARRRRSSALLAAVRHRSRVRRPDELRTGPVRRHPQPGGGTVGNEIRRDPGKRDSLDGSVRLAASRFEWEPQRLCLRQWNSLRPLLLGRVDRDSRASAERQSRSGAQGLDPENQRGTRGVHRPVAVR